MQVDATEIRGRSHIHEVSWAQYAVPMIEFKPERVERVREFLENCDEHGDDAFDHIHRAMACSYKIEPRAKCDTASLIGAIGYLFTGEPEDFVYMHPDRAMELAGRLFNDRTPESRVHGSTLLHDHALAVFSVKPENRGGYIDLEQHHLTLIGGRYLFLMAVRALVEPYEHCEGGGPGIITYKQAVIEDVSYQLRPEIIEAALADNPRHWKFWKDILRRR